MSNLFGMEELRNCGYTKEFIRLLVNDPRVFFENYTGMEVDGKTIRPKMNVGFEASFKLISEGKSHLLYNPRQTGSTFYLASIALWAKYFCPDVKVNHIIRYKNLKRYLMDIYDKIDNFIPNEIKELSNRSYTKEVSNVFRNNGIKYLYIIDEFEFLSNDDIEDILQDVIEDNQIMIIGASTINRELKPELVNKIANSVHWITTLPVVGDPIPRDKIIGLKFPVEYFYSTENIEKQKILLDYDHNPEVFNAEVLRMR